MAKLPTGQKLKFFRNRVGLSQLEVEIETGMSSGSLSRIESSHTNPRKETIDRLANLYKLSMTERSYLDGAIAEPATQEEIESAIAYTSKHFRKQGYIGYLVDDRSYVRDISDTLSALLGGDKESQINVPLCAYILDKKYRLLDLIDEESADKQLWLTLTRMQIEMSFMEGDELYEDYVKMLYEYPKSRKIWETLKDQEVTSRIFTSEERTLTANLAGYSFKLTYSVEIVLNNDRFHVVEYLPHSPELMIQALAEVYKKKGFRV